MPFEWYRPHSLYFLPACLPLLKLSLHILHMFSGINSTHPSGPPEIVSEARHRNVQQSACYMLALLSPRRPPTFVRERESLPAPSHPRSTLRAVVPMLQPVRIRCLQACLFQETQCFAARDDIHTSPSLTPCLSCGIGPRRCQ